MIDLHLNGQGDHTQCYRGFMVLTKIEKSGHTHCSCLLSVSYN